MEATWMFFSALVLALSIQQSVGGEGAGNDQGIETSAQHTVTQTTEAPTERFGQKISTNVRSTKSASISSLASTTTRLPARKSTAILQETTTTGPTLSSLLTTKIRKTDSIRVPTTPQSSTYDQTTSNRNRIRATTTKRSATNGLFSPTLSLPSARTTTTPATKAAEESGKTSDLAASVPRSETTTNKPSFSITSTHSATNQNMRQANHSTTTLNESDGTRTSTSNYTTYSQPPSTTPFTRSTSSVGNASPLDDNSSNATTLPPSYESTNNSSSLSTLPAVKNPTTQSWSSTQLVSNSTQLNNQMTNSTTGSGNLTSPYNYIDFLTPPPNDYNSSVFDSQADKQNISNYTDSQDMLNVQTTEAYSYESSTSEPYELFETFPPPASETQTTSWTTMSWLFTSSAATPLSVTSSTKQPLNETGADALKNEEALWESSMAAGLIAALCFGVIFFVTVLVLVGKRVYDGWKRRHYSKIDYLVNGMYN